MMTNAGNRSQTPAPALRRQLGLASATAVVAGETIAVGIFLTPAGMAKSLSSPFYLLLVWTVVGGLTICGALTYGELAARFPRDGGVYVYLLETYGPAIAFLYGWMCLLVLDPGVTAALAVGLASHAGYLYPASAALTKLVGIGVIAALCILNVLSIPISAGFLRWTTWLKLVLLGFLVVWALGFRLGSWSNFVPFVRQRPGSLPLAPALGAAMIGAFFSFGGWWDVSKIAGEVREPGRTLPRAMLMGVLIVTLAYAIVSAVFLYLVPLRSVTSDETFVAQAGAVLFGHAGAVVFSGIVMVCIFSSIAALIMSAPRVYYAMAQDGLFLDTVAAVHPRFGSPARAILIQGAIASALVAIGNFQQIIAYFMFIAMVFLALAGAAVFIARSRQPNSAAVFLTPAYPLPPLMFLNLVVLLLILVAMHSPRQALWGTGVVLLGLPVYKMFHRSSSQVVPHSPEMFKEV